MGTLHCRIGCSWLALWTNVPLFFMFGKPCGSPSALFALRMETAESPSATSQLHTREDFQQLGPGFSNWHCSWKTELENRLIKNHATSFDPKSWFSFFPNHPFIGGGPKLGEITASLSTSLADELGFPVGFE